MSRERGQYRWQKLVDNIFLTNPAILACVIAIDSNQTSVETMKKNIVQRRQLVHQRNTVGCLNLKLHRIKIISYYKDLKKLRNKKKPMIYSDMHTLYTYTHEHKFRYPFLTSRAVGGVKNFALCTILLLHSIRSHS